MHPLPKTRRHLPLRRVGLGPRARLSISPSKGARESRQTHQTEKAVPNMSIREKTVPISVTLLLAISLASVAPSVAYAGSETEITLQRILVPEQVEVPRPEGPEWGPFAPEADGENDRNDGSEDASTPTDASEGAGSNIAAARNPKSAAGLARTGDGTPEALIVCACALACASAAAAASRTRMTDDKTLPRSER